jgi:hypothetical protein
MIPLPPPPDAPLPFQEPAIQYAIFPQVCYICLFIFVFDINYFFKF